jgi:MFS family permease
MTYLRELRVNYPTLVGACIGLTAGYAINNYTNNIFVPALVHEFGWSRSQIALVGVTLILSAVCQPVAGRITDMIGVRRMVLIGHVFTPLVYVGFSLMTGAFSQFFLLNVLQILTVTTTTGPVVYSRTIAQRFDLARGTALAVATCSPAVAGAFMAPRFSAFVDAHGWRSGYIALAIFTTIGGLLTLILIPNEHAARIGETTKRQLLIGYRAMLSSRVFQLLILAMILCNLSLTLQISQLKLIFIDLGTAPSTAAGLIANYAAGVIAGRLLCGLALDRFPAHVVAAISLGLPALGLGIMAARVSTPTLLAAGALSLGCALGAEGDVVGYLVRRYFRFEVFSSVLGLAVGAIALSGGLGAMVLSAMLSVNGSYTPFLLLCAVGSLTGSGAFLLIGRHRPLSESQ